jgi:hypothetical protein
MTLRTDRQPGQVVDPADINAIASDTNTAMGRIGNLRLDDLLDVSIPTPANGYVLTYDATQNLWRAQAATGGTGGGAVSSVAGRTGAVTLTKGDVGLSQVDNTSDVNKPVSADVTALLAVKADLVSGKVPASQLPTQTAGGVTSVAGKTGAVTLVKADIANLGITIAGVRLVTDPVPTDAAATTQYGEGSLFTQDLP